MLSIALSIFSIAILATELYLGIVVIGTQGEKLCIERAEAPAQYWIWMTFHIVAGIGIPVLAWFAGI